MLGDDYKTVIVTGKGEERNVVIINEDAFNNLIENTYIRADSANHSWLIVLAPALANHVESVLTNH